MVVTSLASAQAAISRIVEDGEGCSLANINDAITSNPAHFHLFLEMYTGRKLIGVKSVAKQDPEVIVDRDVEPPKEFLYQFSEEQYNIFNEAGVVTNALNAGTEEGRKKIE